MWFQLAPVWSITFAHACQRQRELWLASHAKVVHRSFEAAKVDPKPTFALDPGQYGHHVHSLSGSPPARRLENQSSPS